GTGTGTGKSPMQGGICTRFYLALFDQLAFLISARHRRLVAGLGLYKAERSGGILHQWLPPIPSHLPVTAAAPPFAEAPASRLFSC
ncbi:MAG: hypothetical protein ACMG6S_08545, partial [Byssovorax sp.]